MDIVQIAAEFAPIAKVGGLGDVLLGLSRELISKRETVCILLPKYDCLDVDKIEHLEVQMHDLPSYFNGEWHHNTIWKGIVEGVPVRLIESHDPQGFFERQKIYGCPDDISRFTYFSRVALEYLLRINHFPDILHLHDWHVSLIPILLKTLYASTPLNSAKTVLTLHNLAYQGHCKSYDLLQIGLNLKELPSPSHLQDAHYPDSINLLKGGIEVADHVTTVSPTYAKEVLTADGGNGLENVLKKHLKKFSGVLNGIDYHYWNPETDPHLPYHYSIVHLSKYSSRTPYLKEKEQLKSHLRRMFSLKEEDCPLVSCVTRLVHQKGPELIKYALLKTLEKGGQFVLIGSASDEKTHAEFYNLKRKLAESKHVHIELAYNESLSHLVYGASDLFLVPSLFEPCGLTQMIAMRYGTVPLVRETGGLADTVFEKKNGFTFKAPTAEQILPVLDRALHTWYNAPEEWNSLMLNSMKEDFSWSKPAAEYLKLYKQLRLSSLPA